MGWVTRAPMPTARQSLAAGVIDGILYAVGGNPSSAGDVNERYDPGTDTWSSRASMPTARYIFAAGVIDGILYAVGGFTGGTRLAVNESYDPGTDTWASRAAMPAVRSNLAAGVVGSSLYAVGGIGGDRVNEKYDPTTDTWSSRARMPTGRSGLAAGVIGSTLYAVGGYTGSRTAVNEAYDPSTNTWASQASMPTARYGLAAGVVDSTLYAVGGLTSTLTAVNEAYDPTTDTWSSRASMPTARYELAAGVINDILYAVGGNTGSAPTAVNEAYTLTGTVTGTVRDAATLQPLDGVSVTSDDGQATTTGPDGTYTLADVAAGTRTITFSAAGYNPRIEIITVPEGGTYTLNVDLVPAVQDLNGTISDGLTGSLAASVDIELMRDGAITGTVEGTLAPSIEIMPFGVIEDALDGTLAPDIAADAGGAIDDALDGTLAPSIEAAASGTIEDALDGTLAPDIETYRTEIGGLRLDVGPPQGEPIASIFPVLRAKMTWALNDIGSFSVTLPVTAAGADRVDAGMEARVIREGEGEIFRGLIASRRVVLEDDGPVIELEGYSTARELAYRTTQINWRIDAESLASAVSELVADTGWSVTADAEVIDDLVSAEFQGVTRFDAITSLAQQVYRHVRPMPVERRIEITKGERDSGLRCMLLPEWPYGADNEDAILPIARIRVSRRDEDIVTRVIPVGAGEGPAALTLRWATRTSPYPIQTMVGPDGETLYYLEDTAASATYGTRERVIAFKDVAPLANSAAELERAANVLYDLAAAWLQARTSPRVEWAVTVGGALRLRDPLSGAWRLIPGDMVRLVARGAIDDWDGRRVFVDLNTDAFVRGITRSWDGDAEEVELTLTDTSRVVRDDDLLADVVDRIWAVAVAQKTVPVREIHGPFRQTLDDSSPVRMIVDWDANVRFLHQAKLVIMCRRIRANATTAAAGGGQTTSAGTAHSHTVSGQTALSGGGGTSSAGTSHSHTVSGQTAESGGAHLHYVGFAGGNFESWTDPVYRQQLILYDINSNSYGMYVGRNDTMGPNTEFYTYEGAAHTHPVTGTTSSAENTHTHTVPAHSHSVSTTTSSSDTSHTHTVAAHTHALQYGIFEGTYPTGIALRVLVNGTDVTEALGGPWSPSEGAPLTLDITQWLQEPDGRPRQQANTVEVQGAKLIDVELTVKSLIAIATVVPV